MTLPFVRHLKSTFQIDAAWVELSIVEQSEAVASRKVDAAFCRLPLSHDGLVQCTVLFADTRKLAVPAEDGKFAEHWDVVDFADVERQLCGD